MASHTLPGTGIDVDVVSWVLLVSFKFLNIRINIAHNLNASASLKIKFLGGNSLVIAQLTTTTFF